MDYIQFTPQFKDSVLKCLCENLEPYSHYSSLDWREICEDFSLLNTCLTQFKELGLVDDLDLRRQPAVLSISITAHALDTLARGGFVFIEDRYVKDLAKANLELEKLKAKPGLKKYINQIAGITGIISNLITTANAVRGW